MRIGLVGFGAWGRLHAQIYARRQGAELAAIFCHGDATAQAAASAHPEAVLVRSFEDLIALPLDVVAITAPNHLHARYAVAALKAGKHVILEKPLGTTLAECDAVLAAARESGRKVAVNHELRVSQQWRQVREIIAANEIGRVTHQHLSLFRRPFRPGSGGWRQDQASVGSYSLEELVHFVDLVMWYARENGLPHRVTARASDGSAMPQTLSALLDWPDGSTALVTQCLAGFQHHSCSRSPAAPEPSARAGAAPSTAPSIRASRSGFRRPARTTPASARSPSPASCSSSNRISPGRSPPSPALRRY
jgi:predicted dehydrogenase